MDFMSKPVTLKDPTLQYDHETLLTARGGFTVMEVPTIPFAFTDDDERVREGWLATMSLAALKQGRVTLKQVRVPTDVIRQAEALDAHVRTTGRPSTGWPGYLDGQQDQIRRGTPTTKKVFAVASVGARSIPEQLGWSRESGQDRLRVGGLLPVSERERQRFADLAAPVRQSLASGGYRARPVGVETVRALRRHSASRSVGVAATASARPRWSRRDVVDEFADLEFRVGPRWVRVDSPSGSRFVATLVCWGFPQQMLFPQVSPWLGHLDSLPDGVHAESDLVLDLVPMEKARGQIRQRQRAAADQRLDAARAGADLPMEITEMLELGRILDFELPRRRLPLAYGWARVRVDASSPRELAAAIVEVEKHMGVLGIDVAQPVGLAQLDLLTESIPGFPVRHRSWKQRWMLETAACSLQHSGSELGHEFGSFRGITTGREKRAVRIDLHHGITRRSDEDVEQPGGFALLGAQRSGKSSALAQIIDDCMFAGTTNLTLDPSRRLRQVLQLPEHADRADDIDLTEMGGGIGDPLGPLLIPMPASAVPVLEGLRNQAQRAQETARANAVRGRILRERARLARETLHVLAFRQIAAASSVEGVLLNTISKVAASQDPGLSEVIAELSRSKTAAVKNLGQVLAFDVAQADGAGALFGEGATEEQVQLVGRDVVGRVLSMHGLRLPRHDKPMETWLPSEQLGAATFMSAAHLGRRLLFGMDPDVLKVLLVDEAHVPMAFDSGRSMIESTLRDGPKHGVVTGIATHNAADLLDEKIMAAIAMWFLFRTRSAKEMKASHAAAGVPNSKTNREIRAGLVNGECIAKLDTGVTDRFQWQLWRPSLAAAAKTTSTGLAGGISLQKVVETVDRDLDEVDA